MRPDDYLVVCESCCGMGAINPDTGEPDKEGDACDSCGGGGYVVLEVDARRGRITVPDAYGNSFDFYDNRAINIVVGMMDRRAIRQDDGVDIITALKESCA